MAHYFWHARIKRKFDIFALPDRLELSRDDYNSSSREDSFLLQMLPPTHLLVRVVHTNVFL